MANTVSIYIPKGYSTSFSTDATTTGNYVRMDNPGGSEFSPTFMTANTAYTVGPFNEGRNYNVTTSGGTLSFTTSYSGNYTADDEANNEPSTQTAIEDLADDATGAEIATTVNGIIAALVANGILEEFVPE